MRLLFQIFAFWMVAHSLAYAGGAASPPPVTLAPTLVFPARPQVSAQEKERFRSRWSLARLEKEGPMVGGGGGEGIVCFASKSVADSALDAQGRLRSSAREKITHAFTFDVSENIMAYTWPLEGESPRSYLERVIHLRVDTGAPYFASRLRQALDLVLAGGREAENWEDRGALPKLDDAGTRGWGASLWEASGLFCRIVQVAIRYEVYDDGKLSRVFVDYDKDLFDRLRWMNEDSKPPVSTIKGAGVLHQAALLLHEAVYLMGSTLGIHNSQFARILSGFILLEDLKERAPLPGELPRKSTPAESYSWLMVMLRAFGLADHGFAFLEGGDHPAPFTKASRQRSHAFLERKTKQVLDELQAAHKIDAPAGILFHEKDILALLDGLAPVLTEEESFLYLASFSQWLGRSPYLRDTFLLESVGDKAATNWLCHHFYEDMAIVNSGLEMRWQAGGAKQLYAKSLLYCRQGGYLGEKPGFASSLP